MIRREVVSITTNSSGAATAYTDYVSGIVRAIRYVKTDFADGATITITADASGQAILTWTAQNTSDTSYPYAAQYTVADAASLYAAGGVAVNVPIPVANERIKVVVASGGDTKSGAIHFYIET
jgi:hypothetical protein